MFGTQVTVMQNGELQMSGCTLVVELALGGFVTNRATPSSSYCIFLKPLQMHLNN